MTRDEILEAIREASTARGATVPTPRDIRRRIVEVSQLADQYPDSADRRYLVEALADALDRFAAMIELNL